MEGIHLNIGAILGAALAKIALGMVWYSPLLFIKPMLKAIGLKEKDMKASMGKGIAFDIFSSTAMAFVLAHAIKYAQMAQPQMLGGLAGGLFVSFWNWFGFIALIFMGNVIFEKRSWTYFLINSGFFLVAFLLMGAILALWA
jgi:hypothetical protein